MELNLTNEIKKDITNELTKEKDLFQKTIVNILDRASDYIIKALPVNENVKDVIKDVKEAVKTKDLSNIVKTAINSSLREGMEFLNIDSDKIENVIQIKDILFKGGLRETLNACIETSYSKYIKGNIFGDQINKMVDSLKDEISGKSFSQNLENKLSIVVDNQNKVNSLIDEWNKAYENFDLNKINDINNKINESKINTLLNKNEERQIRIINNITEFVNNKNGVLSELEMNFCNNV